MIYPQSCSERDAVAHSLPRRTSSSSEQWRPLPGTCETSDLTEINIVRQSFPNLAEELGKTSVLRLANCSKSPTDKSMASDAESFETEGSSEASFSLDESIKSRRNRFVDQLVTWVTEWLDSRLALIALRSHAGGEASSSQQIRWSFSKGQQSSESAQRNIYTRYGKRKAEDNEDQEEDPDQVRRASCSQVDEVETREFACHFFKHNPQKYQNERCCRCASAGWPSLHRLKYVNTFQVDKTPSQGLNVSQASFVSMLILISFPIP